MDLINIDTLKVKELKAGLEKLGVAFKQKAKVEELRKLLSEANDRKSLGIHPANDPICDIFSDPKAGNPVCMDCLREFGKRYDACVEAAEEKKKAAASGSSRKGPSTKVRGKYANFGELKTALEAAPEKLLTMIVDKLLLEGYTMPDILAEVEERKATDFPKSKDFKSIAIIKKHISFRASKGWVFTVNENGVVQLTGYEHEPQKVSFTTPAVKKEDEGEKKAA